MTNIISISHFQQSTDGYCLPACARMVLAYLGMEYAEDEISRILGTKEFGTPSFAIQKLTRLQLQVVYREWSVAELLSTLDAGQPIIVFVRTGFLDYWQEDFAHAVVVVGATQDKQFWVHDLAQSKGPLTVLWDGLLAGWAEFGYRGAVLLKQL